MSRVKLSEYNAKRLLFPSQLVFSATTATTPAELTKVFGKQKLVVKVDQGIKKRGLQGLVDVGVGATRAVARIEKWSQKGWSQFLVEPLVKHDPSEEQYLSLSRTRSGWQVMESELGGVEIESHWDSVKTRVIRQGLTLQDSRLQARKAAQKGQSLQEIINKLDKYHIAFLELNPVLKRDGELLALDCAAEIDSTALTLSTLSHLDLKPIVERTQSPSEQQIAALDASTPASLKFTLIKPTARIWMLLSGGGASLVLADEVADLGMGVELANYGEYSGAPSEDDTYAYTKIILATILKSGNTNPQAIVIAGGVANFTDVVKTFRGIIRALDEVKGALLKAKLKVFVRRGGPNEEQGLQEMTTFLKRVGLYGSVHGSETPLTRVITEVDQYLHPVGATRAVARPKGGPK